MHWLCDGVAGVKLPQAVADEFLDVPIDKPTELDVFRNDASFAGVAPAFQVHDKWTVVLGPTKGKLTASDDGTKLVYTPNDRAEAGGQDKFRWVLLHIAAAD